jgi:Family of unknown function (DUF5681)
MTKKSTGNGDSNAGQPKPGKRLGGCTGRGFMPGQSGNPKGGRPKTKGLLNALKARVAEPTRNGRTMEDELVEVLILEALQGKNRLTAIQTVFDRLEGRPAQQLNFNDISRALSGKTDSELLRYAETGVFPDGQGEPNEE